MKAIKFFAVAILFSGVSVISSAQVTATATATSTIVKHIGIIKDVDMNFGNVAINSSTGGTVVLAPDGNRTSTGGVILPPATAIAGTVAAAEFSVTGADNYTFSITLPSTSHEIKSDLNTMSVTDFTSTPTTTGALSATGSATVKVGATLNVSAGQAAGTYTSVTPFEVKVNYN